MEDNDIKRIKLHFKELKIKGKLISFCQKEFLHWKRLLEKKNFDIKESFNTRLNEQLDDEILKNWRTAFFKSLLEQTNLIEKIKTDSFNFINNTDIEILTINKYN